MEERHMTNKISHRPPKFGRVELYVAERQSLGISARHECTDVGIAGDLLRVVPPSSPKSELNLSSLLIYKCARKDKHVVYMHV